MAQEIISADSAQVSLNDPVAGQTRVTLNSLTYNAGTNELFVFHNGLALVLGVDYTEEDSTHVVLLFIPDAIAPDVDTIKFQTFVQGSSIYIAPPTEFTQLDPPKRPDNFGGQFVFDS